MKKNMKIEINKDQPIDDVVEVLEGLGFKKEYESDEVNFAITFSDGCFGLMTHDISDLDVSTTLAELKEMK